MGIYPSRVAVAGAETPIDWLRRFADSYGAQVEVEGKKGHFFLFATGYIPKVVKWDMGHGKPRAIKISRFDQRDPHTGAQHSALIVAIDLDKYIAALDDLAVKREDMLDEFVPAPRPHD